MSSFSGEARPPSPAHEPVPQPVPIVPVPTQAAAVEGFVDVSGARLWYWDTGGAGDALILVHPATGSGASWPYQQPVIAQAGYRVIGYSRRGHYRSETASGTSGAAPVAASEDLRQLVDHLGVQKFHLVGSAAGAIVAADYLLSYPETLRSVVLASSVLGIQDAEFQQTSHTLIPSNFMSLPPEFRELGPSYRAANPQGTARWLEIEKMSRASSPGAMTEPPPGTSSALAFMGMTPSKNSVTLEKLAATRRPLLLMTGDADLYMPPAVLVKIAARLEGCELALIPNAGHAAFWEQPAIFNRAVLDFVRRHGSRA